MIDFNVLGQIIDTTFGRSSTPQTYTYSVKFTLNNDSLNANYMSIVNFVSDKDLLMMKRRYEEESELAINSAVRKIKKEYKECTGKSIKLEYIDSDTSIEVIGMAVHNPKRTAYYRRKSIYAFS